MFHTASRPASAALRAGGVWLTDWLTDSCHHQQLTTQRTPATSCSWNQWDVAARRPLCYQDHRSQCAPVSHSCVTKSPLKVCLDRLCTPWGCRPDTIRHSHSHSSQVWIILWTTWTSELVARLGTVRLVLLRESVISSRLCVGFYHSTVACVLNFVCYWCKCCKCACKFLIY